MSGEGAKVLDLSEWVLRSVHRPVRPHIMSAVAVVHFVLANTSSLPTLVIIAFRPANRASALYPASARATGRAKSSRRKIINLRSRRIIIAVGLPPPYRADGRLELRERVASAGCLGISSECTNGTTPLSSTSATVKRKVRITLININKTKAAPSPSDRNNLILKLKAAEAIWRFDPEFF